MSGMPVRLPESVPQRPALVRLFDAEPGLRQRAVEELELGPLEHLYALREVLLHDHDAAVRSAVPRRLIESNDQRVVRWLLESVNDPKPSVREASWLALTRLEVHEALPVAARAIREEETWWVRRAAIRAAARLGRDEAIPLLISALEDPFWRARFAALQALAAMVQTSDAARAAVQRAASSDNEAVRRSAVWVLSNESALPEPGTETIPGVDEDPAVTTHRLEREALPPPTLVRLLGDPHEALRRVARRRLAKNTDLSIARAVAAWLDEPRVPYAPETARTSLGEMRVDPIAVARAILEDRATVGEGQLTWAALQLRDADDLATLRPLLRDPREGVRVAAAAALVWDETSRDELISFLEDASVRAVVERWWLSARARPVSVTEALHRYSASPMVRVSTARALGLTDELRAAFHDASLDGRIRAEATLGLSEDRAIADEDPWVRQAALTLANAPRVVLTDADPVTRRLAMAMLTRERNQLEVELRREVARAASEALDPELRAAAATLVLREDVPFAMRWLMRLSRESSLSIRGAAASALESCDTLDAALAAFLDTERESELRCTAFTWSSRHGDALALERLVRALADERESPEVKSHLLTISLVFSDELLGAHPELVAQQPKARQETQPATPSIAAHESLRPLGATGVQVSPVIFSGAHELDGGAYAEAVAAGATTFFWEPGYRSLTRYLQLRRVQPFTIVTGSYNSGAKWLRRDVESHLRALGREQLDVFLLFWVRSAARLDDENLEALSRLRAEGKIRTFGFSSHLRDVAADALATGRWPVVMTRFSAAHPGAETRLLSTAQQHGVGVLTFTSTCYGRLTQATDGTPADFVLPSALECYQFSLSTPGVSAVVSAPRRYAELADNLTLLERTSLPTHRQRSLREHGVRVRAQSHRFNALVRQA